MLSTLLLAYFSGLNVFSDADWRWAVFAIGFATIFLTIGLLAIGVFLFRKKTVDRSLAYFGLFVVLYAVRMLLKEKPLLSVFDISPLVANRIVLAITYSIALPMVFVFLEIVQSRWRKMILWTLGVQLLFAAIAIPCELAGFALRSVDVANSVLVLASWTVLGILLFLLRPPGHLPRDLRVVAVGIGVLGLFVLYANILGIRQVRGPDLEPIGFLIFICTLGYLVVHRIFVREESLFALQKELEIAEQIQASILPRDVPHLPSLEIAARYLPMSAVAGDFYDFLAANGNQLGILIADVTGHGVPAALIASMLKVAFAGQEAHAEDPARVLSGVNRSLCGKFEDHFVTAAYVFLDVNSKLLRYAGAGHPPLLFANRTGGEARAIEHNGLFLGMFPEAVYTSVDLPLKPGDRYVLYTDGLPESRNPAAEEFGLERCKQYLESRSELPASAFADGLLGEIAKWEGRSSGNSQQDDLTLIVLERQMHL